MNLHRLYGKQKCINRFLRHWWKIFITLNLIYLYLYKSNTCHMQYAALNFESLYVLYGIQRVQKTERTL